jgi:hypothetical protein
MVDVTVEAPVDVSFKGGDLGVQPVQDFLVAGSGEVRLKLFILLVYSIS